MRARIFSTGSIPALVSIAVLCAPVAAFANFKYIPSTQASSEAAPPTAPIVTTVPVTRIQPSPLSGVPQTTEGEVINGFGTQVPLVIALREIVPSSYQFAYGEGLNLGTLVNWKGGKSWREVLHNVVTPLGLSAVEKNAIIYVDRSGNVIQSQR